MSRIAKGVYLSLYTQPENVLNVIYIKEEERFVIDPSIVQAQKADVLSIIPSSASTFEINKEAQGWTLLFTDTFF